MSKRNLLLVLALLAVLGSATVLLLKPAAPPPALAYVGTDTCAGCHRKEHEAWLASDHRHAMELPDAQSVLGNFNDATFDYFGTKSRFTTRDGKYFVETDNARGERETFQVAYTFGHYPLQQYLIAFPDGRMQALSISWDSRPAKDGGQRWFHLYPDEKIAHDDPLHWTGAFQNWNSRCASCHSTDLRKDYSPDTDRYDTKWHELNVGCEACHGQGSRHVAWAKGDHSLADKGLVTNLAKAWEPRDGQRQIPQLADAPLTGQLQACAACHSRRAELQQPDATQDFFDNFSLSPLLDGRYFADGQIHEEVYELGSFLQSRMHQNHVSCTNCHEPHAAKLKLAGNKLCLQCHERPRYQSKDHFFHEPGSPGAQCVACHMPERTYMGVDARRDHSFRVPDPIASLRFGVPDACTQCHKGKGEQWAADAIAARKGRREPYYAHTALLSAARGNDASSAPQLLAYARDAARPPILRSIALLEMGRFPDAANLDALGNALASPDPLLRLGAVAAFSGADLPQRLARLQGLVTDPSKAVRMAVAQQLAQVPLSQAPEALRARLGKLFDEYRQSLLYSADMPESLSNLALLESAQGELDAAEQSLLRARHLSPRYLPAMLNLADLYRARNRDADGEAVLREALAAYPDSADALHTLGLLYVRTDRLKESVPLLERAARLAPANPQYALVHALSLVETGRKAEGIKVLENAARRFPGNAQIQQALTGYR
jgi:predicted CXXCH cytochrome family protein